MLRAPIRNNIQARHKLGAGEVASSKKRQGRDAKFGFGGRKKLLKQNNAESSADMGALGRGKGPGKGKSKRPPGASGGVKKRPGKEARKASRGRGR